MLRRIALICLTHRCYSVLVRGESTKSVELFLEDKTYLTRGGVAFVDEDVATATVNALHKGIGERYLLNGANLTFMDIIHALQGYQTTSPDDVYAIVH